MLKKKKKKKMRRGGVDKKKDHRWQEGLLHFLLLVLQSSFFEMVTCTVTPPLPVTPFPSGRQLAFQRREQAIFFHFGINTFTDRETGTGYDDPSIFNPEGLVRSISCNCYNCCCVFFPLAKSPVSPSQAIRVSSRIWISRLQDLRQRGQLVYLQGF
jgi:hypothetical protein